MKNLIKTDFDNLYEELSSYYLNEDITLPKGQLYTDIQAIPNTGGIYKITSKIKNTKYVGDHECYIGLTVHFKDRLKQHLYKAFHESDKNREYNKALYAAIRKHCEDDPKKFFDNFTFEILEQIENPDLLGKAESDYIDIFNSRKNGYNEIDGGDGGYRVSTEDHWHTALTKDEVIDIRNRLNSCNESMKDIWFDFEERISWKNFTRACYGKYVEDGTWKDLEPSMSEDARKYHMHNNLSRPGELNPNAKVTVNQVLEWRKRLIAGESAKEIYNSNLNAQKLFPNYKSFQNIVSFSAKNWPDAWPDKLNSNSEEI